MFGKMDIILRNLHGVNTRKVFLLSLRIDKNKVDELFIIDVDKKTGRKNHKDLRKRRRAIVKVTRASTMRLEQKENVCYTQGEFNYEDMDVRRNIRLRKKIKTKMKDSEDFEGFYDYEGKGKDDGKGKDGGQDEDSQAKEKEEIKKIIENQLGGYGKEEEELLEEFDLDGVRKGFGRVRELKDGHKMSFSHLANIDRTLNIVAVLSHSSVHEPQCGLGSCILPSTLDVCSSYYMSVGYDYSYAEQLFFRYFYNSPKNNFPRYVRYEQNDVILGLNVFRILEEKGSMKKLGSKPDTLALILSFLDSCDPYYSMVKSLIEMYMKTTERGTGIQIIKVKDFKTDRPCDPKV